MEFAPANKEAKVRCNN